MRHGRATPWVGRPRQRRVQGPSQRLRSAEPRLRTLSASSCCWRNRCAGCHQDTWSHLRSGIDQRVGSSRRLGGPKQPGGGDTLDRTYVVRGGITTADNLAARTRMHDLPYGHSFSVQSAPMTPWPELARSGNFYNNQVSVATVWDLQRIPGVRVVATPGSGYHAVRAGALPAAPWNI